MGKIVPISKSRAGRKKEPASVRRLKNVRACRRGEDQASGFKEMLPEEPSGELGKFGLSAWNSIREAQSNMVAGGEAAFIGRTEIHMVEMACRQWDLVRRMETLTENVDIFLERPDGTVDMAHAHKSVSAQREKCFTMFSRLGLPWVPRYLKVAGENREVDPKLKKMFP